MRMIWGFTARVRAMATRWRMPPESWFGYFFSEPARPTFLIQARATCSRSSRGHPAQHQAEGHVLEHGEPGVGAVALEDHAPVGAGARDGLAAQQGLAGGGREEAGHDVEDRALAAARGAQEHPELAACRARPRTSRSTSRMAWNSLPSGFTKVFATFSSSRTLSCSGLRHHDFQVKSGLLTRRMIWSVTTPMTRITMHEGEDLVHVRALAGHGDEGAQAVGGVDDLGQDHVGPADAVHHPQGLADGGQAARDQHVAHELPLARPRGWWRSAGRPRPPSRPPPPPGAAGRPRCP